MSAPLKGLVLSGGRSRRMQQDKATLSYAGQTQLDRAMHLLGERVSECFVSARADQAGEPTRARHRQILDVDGVEGPIAGILAAQQADPGAAWLVLACDLPLLDATTLSTLIAARSPQHLATAYRSAHDGLPEPLCAIFEPSSAAPLRAWVSAGRNCPRKFLINHATLLIDQPNPEALDNVNTPEEFKAVQARVAPGDSAAQAVRVQYFALLREQAGRSEESLATAARTPRELFAELAARHGFTLAPDMLKVAINNEFAEWSQPLRAGDSIVFIPPVAGG